MNHSIQVADEERDGAARVVSRAYQTFQRLLAVCFFVLALYVWASSIGFWQGAEFRFDTMTTNQRIISSVLLVLHPVAAAGLWTTLSWGRVMWLLAVAVHVGAIFYLNMIFPHQAQLLLFHVVALVLYVFFEIAVKLVANKA